MKKVIASAGLLALGAVGVQTTQAQLSAGNEKSWSVSATLRGFYDDNYNTQPDGPDRRGTFGFEVRPSAAWDIELDQTSINLQYIYSLRYYDDRPDHKDDQSHDFEVQLTHTFSPRYSVNFADSFVIAQEPDLLDPNNTSLPFRSNGNNLRNTASINFNATVTELLGFVAGYANTIYDYEENAGNTITPLAPSRSALLDRVEHTLHLDSRWNVMEQTVLILGYAFGAVDYLSQESIDTPPGAPIDGPLGPNPFYVPSDSRNNYSHTVYVGIEHNFRADLSFNGKVGIEYLDYYNSLPGNSSSSVSPWVDLGLNYNYSPDGSASLSFHHGHNQTDEAASAANPSEVTLDEESSTVYLSVSQKLTPISPRLSASATAQYQNSVFNGGLADSLTDNIYLLGLNLAYQFDRYFSAEVGYNYDLLSSDLPGRAYNRNRVYIGMTATY